MPIAAIVLAAGASTRLGRPKQTVTLGTETLIARAVRIAAEAGLTPIIVVVAPVIAPGASFAPALAEQGCLIVTNPAAEGMSTSIVAGIHAAQNAQATGAVILTCDQVAVTPGHLRALCADPDEPAGSHYAGRTGVPAYFPASAFPTLLTLTGDTGARELLQHARALPTEALAFDIDTEADLTLARTQFAPKP